MEQPSLLPLLVIPAFFIVFPLFWVGVVYLISVLSGWRGLAARYRLQGAPAPVARAATGRIGLASYRGVLRVGYDRGGLYLGVMSLFRVGHPELFIPWGDVASVQQGKELFSRVTRLEIAGGPTVTLYGDWTELERARS